MRRPAIRWSPRLTSSRAPLPLLAAVATILMAAPAAATMSSTPTAATASSPVTQPHLDAVFEAAAREFDVPRDLLVAIGYTETHLDSHDGEPSVDGGYGLMHLVRNPSVDTLDRAHALLGVPEPELRESALQNVRGGAALLRDMANRMGFDSSQREDLGAWFPVVARYSNAVDDRVARVYADQVYRLLRSGLKATTVDGQRVVVRPRTVHLERGRYTPRRATTTSPDYPAATWAPAYVGNYSDYSRGKGDIKYIVLHTTQGSYAGAISWFQNPSANVSAHYVIRSADGQVTQTVREQDVAWHAGNWTYNLQSIGIEHEGWVGQTGWYTDPMYRSSAMLVRHLADKYDIPLDRQHILGHSDVPGATHTDPGSNWDWKYYMGLVRGDAPSTTSPWSAVVDNDDSQFAADSAWGTSQWSATRYGSDYRYAEPSQESSDTAWFRFSVPTDGVYRVFVRYPSNTGYNSQTRVKVRTPAGTRSYTVDQRLNGGTWVRLDDVSLVTGDRKVVGISRRSPATGYIIADAVRLRQL